MSNLSPNTTNRKKTVFAIGAFVVLVGVAFAAAMFMGGDGETAATQDVAGDATASVAGLGDFQSALSDVQGSADAASQTMGSVHSDADARVNGAVADAKSRVGAAAGAHADVLATGDIEGRLGNAVPASYDVDALRAEIEGATAGSFLWDSMPSTVPTGTQDLSLERTGTEADEAFSQAEAAFAQIRDAMNSAEVQTLWATIDATHADLEAQTGRDLPQIPGLLRAPLSVTSSVEPDEDGAQMALDHADQFLGTVNVGYGDVEAGLDRIHEVQSGLGAEVEGTFDAAETFRGDAHAAVESQYEARLSTLEQTAADYRAEVEAAAAAHVDSVRGEADAALVELESELDAERSNVEAALAEQQSALDAKVQDVRAEADARIAEIEALEAQVRAHADAGKISQADAQAFFSASAEAKAAAEAHVANTEAQVQALKAQLSSDAEDHLADAEARAAEARAEIEGEVADAEAWAEARKAELTAEVDGALETAMAAQAEARAEVDLLIDAYVDTLKADVKERALELVAQARAEADNAQLLASGINAEAYTEVGKDVEYILAVAEDYSDVPTPERQAAADAWNQVAGEVDGTLSTLLVQGATIDAKADAVLSAAADAEAQISGLF